MNPSSLAHPSLGAVVGGAVVGGRRCSSSAIGGDDGRPPRSSSRRRSPPPRRDGEARGADGARDLQARRARRGLHPRPDRPAGRLAVRLRAARSSREATGSGFVLDKRRLHPHQRPRRSRARRGHASSSPTSKTVEAKVEGKDTSTDLALLKVDPDGLDLKPLALGTSKDVQVGDPTIAIGNPFGLDRTLTTGVVSALQRQIQRAQRLRDLQRHPDRRRDQPRQLGRPADRRRRPRDRDQLADRDRRRAAAATSASASPSRSTPPSRSSPQLKGTGSVKRAYLGDHRR